MKNARLLELDAVRGIAAVSVVIFHYFYQYDEIFGHKNIFVDWARPGKFGVQLFFMVSGFVIYWTLNKVEKPLDFIISRLSRLYPAFWFSAILSFLIILFFGLPEQQISLTEALWNGLMFHEYMEVKHIDGVYWTLTLELTFYAWMFSFYVFGGLKYAEYLFIPFIILSILQSFNFFELSSQLNNLFLTQYLSFFVVGICFYKIINKLSSIWTYIVIIFCLFSTLVILSINYFILSCLFYCFFFLAVSEKLKFLVFKPFVFLGGISYSLYLIHQNIGYVIINVFYELNIHPIIGIFTAVIVSVLLAEISTRFIEKPSLLYIRKKY